MDTEDKYFTLCQIQRRAAAIKEEIQHQELILDVLKRHPEKFEILLSYFDSSNFKQTVKIHQLDEYRNSMIIFLNGFAEAQKNKLQKNLDDLLKDLLPEEGAE